MNDESRLATVATISLEGDIPREETAWLIYRLEVAVLEKNTRPA